MQRQLLSILVLGLISLQFSFGQNRPDFFKVPLEPVPELPEWAQLMYAEDPNVYEVDFAYHEFYRTTPFVKNLHTQNYRHWRRLVEPYLTDEGLIRLPSPQQETDRNRVLRIQRSHEAGRDDSWTSLGPVETYAEGGTLPISWHANVYSIDQADSDPDILYAGTEGGGVFKTIDHGLSWELVSKNEEFSNGITGVGIHPEDPDRVIVAGNRRLYQSTDGGASWAEILFIDGSGYEIKYLPGQPDTIFCASVLGLWRSNDGGANWSVVFEEACWDLDFHPSNPEIVYALLSVPGQNRSAFYRSVDTGENWEEITSGWYEPENDSEAAERGGKIAVTPADPDRVYVCLIGDSKAGDSGWIGVYRSDDQGQNFTNPSDQIGGPYNSPNTPPWNVAAYADGYHQGFYNFDFEASHNDADKIWVGTIRLSESANGGDTFFAIGAANSDRLSRIHADIQAIEVNGDEIWVASDGGINYSNDELFSHESRKFGIIASDFWGFGSGWNEDVLVGGKYHNGNSAYFETYPTGKYLHVGGVEEATGYVNPLVNRRVYFNRYWAGGTVTQLIPDHLEGDVINQAQVTLIPNESYVESTSSGLYFDPRYADHMYLGNDGSLYKSTNGGGLFEELHNFGDGKVLELAIPQSSPNVIYAVFQPGGGYWDWCEIHRSLDGGENWTKLTDVPGNRWRLNIAVNPSNKDELWVAGNSADNGEKVFRTLDGGQNWTNHSSAVLDEQRSKDLFFQAGTESTVYLATNNAIFYWKEDTSEWINYSDGLPFVVSSLKMAPFYRDNKLRLSTYGRGIWEAPLAVESMPIAQPMTAADKIYCARDTVQFESHSVIQQEGATWEWTFEPPPQYISDPSLRNPKVVFGEEGDYTASLSISDASGQSSSRTEHNMVSVLNYCEADTVPGQALITTISGDWAQTEDFNMSTNTFTITAWVKPEGIQEEYSSIVMNDNTAAGLNFREQNNTLAYHWPGGAWWWDSDLTVEPDEWSYVALVIAPDGATVYVNGTAAHHAADLDPVQLSTMKIGSYQGWSDRNFRGAIEEVTIWNRSLSTEEIRRIRHLTRDKLLENDGDLIAYYQFNEPEGRINDKAGNNHASLSGGARRQLSTAPVGGGRSQRLVIDEPATVANFDSIGIALDLTDTGSSGILVASKLNVPPANAVQTGFPIDEGYWIVNHYGENVAIDFPYLGLRPDNPLPEMITAEQLQTHIRFENSEHGQEWWTCAPTTVTPENNEVGITTELGCLLNSFGQFSLHVLDEVSTNNPIDNQKVNTYPNPSFSGQEIYLSPAPNKPARLRLYSSEGKLQLDSWIDNSGLIRTPELAAGVYFFQLQGDGFIRHGQLIIGR